MQEIIDASLRYYTFPFTMFLLVTCFFWILVIVGGAGPDTIDLGFEGDVDFDIDADADANMDSMGVFKPIAQCLHLGQVPIMIPLTILFLSTWSGSIFADRIFNQEHDLTTGFLLLIPNIVIALFISWVIGLPFRKFFKIMNNHPEDMQKAIGSICEVACPSDEKYGRALIYTDNAPMQILIYTHSGESFKKGDEVNVVSFNKKLNRYLVEKEEQ